jgi:hypothetical protein
MERQRKIFNTFLALNAHHAVPTEEPVVHLQFYDGRCDSQELLALTRDDVLEALDPSSELVRWLLEQMRTYDCLRQRIVALVFDKKTVLSEVLRCA